MPPSLASGLFSQEGDVDGVGKWCLGAFGNGLDGVGAGLELHVLPSGYVQAVGDLGANGFAINYELHLWHVGKYGDGRRCIVALGEASLGDVDHRFGVPIGFIEVVGIFGSLAVKGDEAFIVDTVAVAFGAMSGSEIKHIPHKRAPHKFTIGNVAIVLDVVVGLPVFGMPISRRHGLTEFFLLMIDACSGAIFADAYAQLRMLGVGGVEKLRKSGGSATIPAVRSALAESMVRMSDNAAIVRMFIVDMDGVNGCRLNKLAA